MRKIPTEHARIMQSSHYRDAPRNPRAHRNLSGLSFLAAIRHVKVHLYVPDDAIVMVSTKIGKLVWRDMDAFFKQDACKVLGNLMSARDEAVRGVIMDDANYREQEEIK